MNGLVYTKQTSYGTFRSDKAPTFIKGTLIVGVIFCFAMALLSIFLLSASFTEDMEETLYVGIVGFLAFGGFGLLSLRSVKKLNAAYEEFCEEAKEKISQYKKAHPHLEQEKFFKRVRAAGISSLSSEADIARLLLYAKNNGITKERDELIKDFNIGKQDIEQQENESQLSELRKEEETLEKKYTRYAETIGLEKHLAICRDKCEEETAYIASLEQKSNTIHQGAEATYRLNKEKESSWALHGGIASGIAGGAAGLAVAADVQRKNADIQQRNRQLAQSVAAMEVAANLNTWDAQARAEKRIKQWQKKAEISKMLLTDFVDEDELLSMLKPQVISLQQSKTGAIALKIEIHAPSNFYIYENVEAAIDGSIAVFLKKDDKIVGTTFCVAGFGGYSQNFKYPRKYDCICTNVSEKADTYEVSFAPYHLWAVEKKDFDKLCCDDK